MRLTRDSLVYLRPLLTPRVLADNVITSDEMFSSDSYLVTGIQWPRTEVLSVSQAQMVLGQALLAPGSKLRVSANLTQSALEGVYEAATDPRLRFRAADKLGDAQKRTSAMTALLSEGGEALKVLRAHRVSDLEAARFLALDIATQLSTQDLQKLLTAMPKLGLSVQDDIAASFGSAGAGYRGWAIAASAEKLTQVSTKAELGQLFKLARLSGNEAFLFAERALVLLDKTSDRVAAIKALEQFLSAASPAHAGFLFENLDASWLKASELPTLLETLGRIDLIRDPKVRTAATQAIDKTPLAHLAATSVTLAKSPLSVKEVGLLEAFRWRRVDFSDAVAFSRALARSVSANAVYQVSEVLEAALKRGLSAADALAEARAIIALAPHNSRAISDMCNTLGIDVRTMTRKTVAKTVLAAWAKQPLDYGMLASAIDALHEGESDTVGSDNIRKDIIAGLPEEALYRLTAQARTGSFTSTFKLMEKRLATFDSGFIARVDPQGRERRAFVLTLGAFQGDALLQKWQDPLSTTLFEAFRSGHNDDRALLSGAFISLLKNGSQQTRAYLESSMRAVIAADAGDTRAAMVFVLKHAQSLGVSLSPASLNAIAKFPALASVAAPTASWLKDGMLSIQLFFYPDETAMDETAAVLRQEGFVQRMEKGLSSKDTYVYERQVGGIKQRLVLSRDAKMDRSKPFDDAAVDVVVHRGHSYHLDETFPQRDKAAANRKLVIGGSCGSFRDMSAPDFLDSYGTHLLIADVDTGTGYVNDIVLVRLLAALTRGETDFAKMNLGDLVKGQGIRLPTEPAMQFATYLAAVRAALP